MTALEYVEKVNYILTEVFEGYKGPDEAFVELTELNEEHKDEVENPVNIMVVTLEELENLYDTDVSSSLESSY